MEPYLPAAVPAHENKGDTDGRDRLDTGSENRRRDSV